jgi:hypothetical protein
VCIIVRDIGWKKFIGILMIVCYPVVAEGQHDRLAEYQTLTEMMSFWRANAPRCAGPSGYAFPSGEKLAGGVACEDGDMVHFNGLLCVSGETEACEMVLHSQVVAGTERGRWFRSPRRKELGNDHDQDGKLDDELDGEDFDSDGRFEEQELNSFSPDMSIGVMLALAHLWSNNSVDPEAASLAKVAAQEWWTYLAAFSPTQCQRVLVADLPPPFGKHVACVLPAYETLVSLISVVTSICPGCASANEMSDLKFFCNHWGCIIRPGDYSLLAEFERFVGINAPHGAFRGGLGSFLPYATENFVNSAKMNDEGYAEHTLAAGILLMRLMGRGSSELDEAASLLQCSKNGLSNIQRRQLDARTCEKELVINPFFQFLVEGPTNAVVTAVLEACPDPDRMPGPNMRIDWMWEKDSSHRSWQRSMYWDCIFMGRLLGAN